MSSLSLKGNFSQGEMHSWISNCLPEVPERIDSSDVNVLIFKNVFVQTFLVCKYSKGEAEFRSDNVSTISIMKDFITKEATAKHIKIELTMSTQRLRLLMRLIKVFKLFQQTSTNQLLNISSSLLGPSCSSTTTWLKTTAFFKHCWSSTFKMMTSLDCYLTNTKTSCEISKTWKKFSKKNLWTSII